MNQREIWEICHQLHSLLVSMRLLLHSPTLEPAQMSLLRMCHTHVAEYHERLVKLIGPAHANYVLLGIYGEVLQNEQREQRNPDEI